MFLKWYIHQGFKQPQKRWRNTIKFISITYSQQFHISKYRNKLTTAVVAWLVRTGLRVLKHFCFWSPEQENVFIQRELQSIALYFIYVLIFHFSTGFKQELYACILPLVQAIIIYFRLWCLYSNEKILNSCSLGQVLENTHFNSDRQVVLSMSLLK